MITDSARKHLAGTRVARPNPDPNTATPSPKIPADNHKPLALPLDARTDDLESETDPARE